MSVEAPTLEPVRTLAFPGSLRTGSFTQAILGEACRQGQPKLEIEVFEGLDRVPFFNQDDEGHEDAPPEAVRLREAVTAADALLFVLPEYNRSIPSTVKNAIDWCTRPFGQGCMTGKISAIMTASPGPSGGLCAYHHARQILYAAGARPSGRREFAVPFIVKFVNEEGQVTDETVQGWIGDLLDDLHAAVVANSATAVA